MAEQSQTSEEDSDSRNLRQKLLMLKIQMKLKEKKLNKQILHKRMTQNE